MDVPISVVTRVQVSSPSSSSSVSVDQNAVRTTNYYYANAKYQAAGRGFLGFEKIMELDETSGIQSITAYRQDWPFIGLVQSKEVRTSQGSVLNRQKNTWALKGWQSNWPVEAENRGTAALGVMKPYISQAVSDTYTLQDDGLNQGILLSRVTTTTHSVDEYLNPLRITETTEGTIDSGNIAVVATKEIVNQYGTQNWQKQRGLLTHTAVTETRGAARDTRTSSFTYYDTGTLKGLLKNETIEPDDSTLRSVDR